MYKTNHLAVFLLFLVQIATYLYANRGLFDELIGLFGAGFDVENFQFGSGANFDKVALIALGLTGILIRTYVISNMILVFRIFDIVSGLKWAFLFWLAFALAEIFYASQYGKSHEPWHTIIFQSLASFISFISCFTVLIFWKKKFKIFSK